MSTTKEDTIIKTPSETDVLCGRGAPINRHSGNILFRKVVKCNKELYNVCTKKERYYVAESIVQALQNQSPPTRFLEAYQDLNGGSDEMWVAISKERAIRKTVQALREKNSSREENQTHDLRGMLSRESSKKKVISGDSDFAKEDVENWNKLMTHLVPPSTSVCEDEDDDSSIRKRQKTSHKSSPSSTEAAPPAPVTPDRIPSASRRVSISPSDVSERGGTDLSVEQLINGVEVEETPLDKSVSHTPKEEIPLAEPLSVDISPSISDVPVEDDWETTKIDFDQFMAQEDFGEELGRANDNDRFKMSQQTPVIQDLHFEDGSSHPNNDAQSQNTPEFNIDEKKNDDDWLEPAEDLILDDRVMDDKWFDSSDTKDIPVEPQIDDNDDWVFESPTLVEW